MKITILLLLVCGAKCFGQTAQEQKLLGLWEITEFKHYDSDGNIDEESTSHFGNMILGRTFRFNADGTVDIPLYTGSRWKISNDTLCIQYGENGRWSDKKIISFDDEKLEVSQQFDIPVEGNWQTMTYIKLEN